MTTTAPARTTATTTTTATAKAPRPVRLAVLLLAIVGSWLIVGYVAGAVLFGAFGAVRMLCAAIVVVGRALGTV